ASITTPAIGTTYSGGQTISFSATGTDPETGDLPASAFTWEVVFHHNVHTHPFLAPQSGTKSGSFVIPTIGETSATVYYAILLTVSAAAGNLILVGIGLRTVGFTSVTDGQGNGFTQVGTEILTPALGVRTRLYYARNIRGGAEAVTVTLPANDQSLQVYVAE